MCMRAVTIIAAIATLSAGWLEAEQALAGASSSACSKFGHATQTASVSQTDFRRHVRHERLGFTEFSSSSASHHQPTR